MSTVIIFFKSGFGKEVFGFNYKQTRYSFGWIPLGGFVKPAGEDYLEKKDKENNPPKKDEYFGQPWYSRLFVVVAGPFMNYMLAIIIFTFVFWIWGGSARFASTTIIADVQEGMPAHEAGLMSGDKIIQINDTAVNSWDEMARIIHKNPGNELLLRISRGKEIFDINIAPKLDEEKGIGLIGIYQEVQLTDLNIFESVQRGIHMTWMISEKTVSYLVGTIRRLEKPKDVAGPIGIFKFISDAARTGMREFLTLLGLLSVAIGLFNLFPIPMLDGGHVIFYLLEGILRKPLNQKVMLIANYIGMAFLLTILLYASYNDIIRLRKRNPNNANDTAVTEPLK